MMHSELTPEKSLFGAHLTASMGELKNRHQCLGIYHFKAEEASYSLAGKRRRQSQAWVLLLTDSSVKDIRLSKKCVGYGSGLEPLPSDSPLGTRDAIPM